MSEEFGKEYWEQRWDVAYRDHAAKAHSMPPNPQLVTEAADLVPGTALDAGCGHGADAIWLASRGWQVMAADIAATALRHASERADAVGADVANRIDWVQADLSDWTPPEEAFDLVSTHYVHPAASRDAVFRRLAAAVAPGGMLLIVGHLPTSPDAAAQPSVYFTADDVAASLDPDQWDIAVAEARSHSAAGHDGHEVTVHDAVLRARKRLHPAPTRSAHAT